MEKQRDLRNLIFKLLSLCVSFLSTMLITRLVVMNIGSETYGFFSMSNDFVNYALIISIALNSMASRYITISYYENNNYSLNQYFNSIFFANIFLALILIGPSLLIVINLENIVNIPIRLINDVKLLFFYMFANFLLNIISSVFNVATFLKNRIDLDSLRSIESYIIRVVIIIFFFKFFTPRVWYMGLATLISTVYIFIINILYVKKLTPEIEPLQRKYFSFKHIKEVIRSGIWNSFTRIGAVLLNGLDLIVANLYVSTSAMGILSVSKTIPKLIASALSSFAVAFTPKITIAYARNENENLLNSITIAIEICALLSMFIQSVVIVLGKNIYYLWLPSQNGNQLYMLSAISMIGYLVLMPFECIYTVFTITNKVKNCSIYLFTEAIITIGTVMIGINIVTDDFLKISIIAGVSSIAELIRGLLFLPLYSAHCLKISKKTFYKPLIKIIIANGIIIVLGMIITNKLPVSLMGLITGCIAIGFLAIVTWWFVVMDYKFRKIVISIMKGRLNK